MNISSIALKLYISTLHESDTLHTYLLFIFTPTKQDRPPENYSLRPISGSTAIGVLVVSTNL
jgi:hypothetical protein